MEFDLFSSQHNKNTYTVERYLQDGVSFGQPLPCLQRNFRHFYIFYHQCTKWNKTVSALDSHCSACSANLSTFTSFTIKVQNGMPKKDGFSASHGCSKSICKLRLHMGLAVCILCNKPLQAPCTALQCV